jgi:hypothetical protein
VKLATSLALVFLLVLSGSALANGPSLSNTIDLAAEQARKDAQVFGVPNPEVQVGGEDVATAANIPAIPYSDSGNTCAYLNDYDEICPYTGSTSPDVVYKYSPAADISLTVSLCNTLAYDTKLYIYENSAGNLLACNDDAGCGYSFGYSSELECVAMTAGNTYYIVIDGYGGDCGDYILDITECTPCVVDCPAGSFAEGEPSGGCADDYTDNYNGGCNSVPPVFQAVPCPAGSPTVTICGGMGGFSYFGSSYRDTDWYELDAAYNTSGVTACVTGEYETVLGYITPADCAFISAFDDYIITPECVQGCINVPAGNYWIFVGVSAFGPTVGCHDYVLEISGYDCGPISVEPSTWGQVKNQYR